MKYTYILTALLLMGIWACKKDDDDGTSYVPQTPEQDDEDIVMYATNDTVGLDLGLAVEDLIPLEEGVYISHIEEGTGDNIVNDTTDILVHYTGYYITSGERFENTQPYLPRLFSLESNIAGWRIALKEMKRGGRAHVFIPSRQAYSNGNLHFTITLEGFTLDTDERENYENGLIQDFFSAYPDSVGTIITDTANVYYRELPSMNELGDMPSLTDTVEISFNGFNVVTESKRDSVKNMRYLLSDMNDCFKLALPLMKEGGNALIYAPSSRNSTDVDAIRYNVTLNAINPEE